MKVAPDSTRDSAFQAHSDTMARPKQERYPQRRSIDKRVVDWRRAKALLHRLLTHHQGRIRMTDLKKLMSFYLLVAASALTFTGNAHAYGGYGNNVNDFCADSNPYTGDCLLCHTASDKKDPTEAKAAWSSGDLCFFCTDDSACSSGPVDQDNDGFTSDVDCNDSVAAINPGAQEVCNDRLDNDCNGLIDAQDPACGTLVCTDNDGDGYSVEGGDCGPVDCADNNGGIYPGASDVCNDGIDQDCSGADRTKGKGCKLRTGREGKGKTCSDGVDNDADGTVDCEDPGCSGHRACAL
jgi:hypothetical protein